MTRSSLLPLRATAVALLLAAAMLPLGCGSGSDGNNGAPGPAGPAGPPGPTDTSLTKFETSPGVDVTITSLSGSAATYFEPGETITVVYTLLKDDGEPWDIDEMNTARILVSGPTFNYQRVITERSDLKTVSTYLGNGQWSYTFPVPIPATYQAPYNDTDAFGAADGELQGQPLLDGTYTVGMYLAWNYTVDGQSGFRDVGNTHDDFLIGSTATMEPREVVAPANCNECHVDLQAHGGLRRDPVLCAMCHTAGAEDKNDPLGSGSGQSSIGPTPGVTIEFKVMIHKLHNGGHLPSVLGVSTASDGSRIYNPAAAKPYRLVGFNDGVSDFSHVMYPVWPNLSSPMPKDFGYSNLSSTNKGLEDTIRGGATACFKCHGDPDGDGPITAVPAQGDLYKTQPSRKACGSCHDDVDWSKPYAANQQFMAVIGSEACNSCHSASGSTLSITDAHVHPLENPAVDPGVVSEITAISGGSGAGGRFLDNDVPTVQFTLKNNAGDDIGLPTMDSASAIMVGPTDKRQAVFPLPTPNGISLSPYDFAGRLASSSTSGKGLMSKVVPTGTAVKETLTVQFSTPTDFSVTGSVSGSLGSGTLPGSASTNPVGSSLGSVILTSAAVAQQITVSFTGPTAFSVTGTVNGAMGSGTLPNTVDGKSCSNRFTSNDGSVSFTVTAGATAFAAAQNIFLTVFKGSAGNPVVFAVVAGRTAFSATAPAPDRFYYEFVPAAASYTLTLPMDLVLEYLGDVSGATPFTAANTPVYFGRQTVWEVTAVSGTVTAALSASADAQARSVSIPTTGPTTDDFVAGDFAVIEPTAGVGTREYVQVGQVDASGTGTRLLFKTPLRYDHAGGVAISKATLSFRQEGAANQYTLIGAAGTVTPVAGFTDGNAVVVSYRTDGRFGWKRHQGSVPDALQTLYQPPPNDSSDLGQDWGEWTGLPFEDGTYTASIWFANNLEQPVWGETQTYRSASVASLKDFLYGAGSTAIEPEDIVESNTSCNACHMTPTFHGLGRAGLESCLLCHGILGAEDKPKYDTAAAPDTTGVTIAFRTMLHKIHMGEELDHASTYQVAGNGGAASSYEEVGFPAMPGGVKRCAKCHGDEAEAWKLPNDENHPLQTVPTRAWRAACNSCHDADDATAHIDAMTPGGEESCAVCHGPDGEFAVAVMHRTR